MTTVLGTLLEVQDLDTAILQLEHRRAALDERRELDALMSSLDALDRQRAGTEAAREELAVRQTELEAQIASATSRHASIERRLYGMHGGAARDLQALSEEIAHLSARRDALENELLEVLVSLEPIDEQLALLDEQREASRAAEARLRAALAASESLIDAERSERVASRTAAAARLPEELRSRYDALRARLGGTGAARLVGSRCTGCHLELPSMEVERIRHLPPGSVVTCEQCGRILVPADPGAFGAAPV